MQMTGPKDSRRTIPSEVGLLTTAMVTQCEPDRMLAARRWIENLGDREKHLLSFFWEALDTAPDKPDVTEIKARHVSYK